MTLYVCVCARVCVCVCVCVVEHMPQLTIKSIHFHGNPWLLYLKN